jgi:hypothetical protein
MAVEMIRIRITGAECEVAGSPSDLRCVAKALVRVSRTGLEEKIAIITDFDPRPYHEALALLRVIRADGPRRVSRESGSLVVSASSDGLTRLASLFDMPDELQDGYHCHRDGNSDSRIASDSVSLVVTVEHENRPI